MALLRIERTPVAFANLGLLGFDHLQLVLQQAGYDPRGAQDGWYVLEGVLDPRGVLGVEGSDGVTTLTEANGGLTGDALIGTLGTPATRGSRVLLSDASALTAWTVMSAMAREIAAQKFPYIGFALPGSPTPIVTSSSVIASLMYAAGLDIAQSWPSGIGFSPGWTTLLGTRAGETLSIQQSFTTILAGAGNDTLEGSSDGRTDKLYGGLGNDAFLWSSGTDYIHGGQPGLAYKADGVDTMNYAGAGIVTITGNPDYVPHKTATFTAEFSGGKDYLFSIERLEWNSATDTVIFKNGASILRDGLKLTMGGEASGGHGDTLDLSGQVNAVLVNAASGTAMSVIEVGHADSEQGLWVDGAEWLVGTSGDDLVYADGGLHGIEAGGGDDLVDAREVVAFSGTSPAGYDIEIDGGDGDDTLVANSGRSLLHGGAGADRFILPSLTGAGGTAVEVVIDDADAGDTLLVPWNLFNGSGLGLDGSQLMPVLGGLGTYADLQQGLLVAFEWRKQSQLWFGSNLSQGVITFIGEIEFVLEGSDLLVHLYQGELLAAGGIQSVVFDPATETTVRIKNYQPGDLGLQFLDPGQPTFRDLGPGYGTVLDFPNWDAAVQTLTAGGQLTPALDARPTAPATSPDEQQQAQDQRPVIQGTAGDDSITLTVAQKVEAGAGNDSVTGSGGGDSIDGGSGADSMAGGGGNDSYVVDNVGDTVVENASEGHDQVSSTIDYTLTANVEDLVLDGAAISGSGNGLDNRIVGNDRGNSLFGGDGDDVLAGDLGNDTLTGGAGSDAVVYALGDGDDRVLGTAADAGADRLVLYDIAPEAVTLLRLGSAPDDLVLRFADGGSVTLAGYFAAAGSSVQQVVFGDGITWSAAQLAQAAAGISVSAALPVLAGNDPYLLAAHASLVIPAASLLANDIGGAGRTLSIVAVQSLSGGTVTLRGDGDLDFTAPPSGATVFTYTVSDGLTQATATGTIGFDPNHAPIVTASLPDASLVAGTAFSLALAPTLFTDPDFDPLQLTATLAGGAALPSWLTFDAATWTLAGTPPPSTTASALDVVVRASDGLDAATVPLHLAIAAGVQNRAPVAVADSFVTTEGQALALTAAALLANDSDPDGDALTLLALGPGSHGTLAQAGDGTLTFTPDAGYAGSAGFSYTISDGHGGTASADVAITITPLAGLTLTGTAGNDLLVGQDGNDTITGGAGNDTLRGAGGNDVFLVAGANTGFDIFDGGAGSDRIQGSAGNDTIGLANGAGALSGIEVIDGGAGADTLRGTAGADAIDLSAITLVGIELIDGGAGNDTIIGSAGSDTIRGGLGNDVLRGGGGDDTFLVQGLLSGPGLFDGGSGVDTILGSASADLIWLAVGSGSLVGIEVINGGGGTDVLRGSVAADTLDLSAVMLVSVERIEGGAGNDTITGSLGDDRVLGGLGADTFVMKANGGRDTIGDFQLGSRQAPLADVVDVTAWGWHALADVLAHASVVSGSTVIAYNATTSVTLTGILPNQLHGDDFMFA